MVRVHYLLSTLSPTSGVWYKGLYGPPHMSREVMMRRTVELVTELRGVVEPCLELYTRGRTRTGSIDIPHTTVVVVFGRTAEFRRVLESIGTTFWVDSAEGFWNGARPQIERKVKTVVTVPGYEQFRVVRKQWTDLGDYWNYMEQSLAWFTLTQGHIFFQELSRYMVETRRKFDEICRCVDTVMYMDVQRRSVTGPRPPRSQMRELLWQLEVARL